MFYQLRDKRLAGRGIKGVGGAQQKRQNDDVPRLYQVREGQRGQNGSQHHHGRLGDHDHAPAWNSVGHNPAEQGKEQRGQAVGKRDIA
ncbi:hypothetical protein SDC9_146348 [bioreactor metagenome]|uniref:Uncharacterized protein n=1 Tax=bioreactor metagenome TaxID=1076179 RepID=A0A645EB00_9ZZZZ